MAKKTENTTTVNVTSQERDTMRHGAMGIRVTRAAMARVCIKHKGDKVAIAILRREFVIGEMVLSMGKKADVNAYLDAGDNERKAMAADWETMAESIVDKKGWLNADAPNMNDETRKSIRKEIREGKRRTKSQHQLEQAAAKMWKRFSDDHDGFGLTKRKARTDNTHAKRGTQKAETTDRSTAAETAKAQKPGIAAVKAASVDPVKLAPTKGQVPQWMNLIAKACRVTANLPLPVLQKNALMEAAQILEAGAQPEAK